MKKSSERKDKRRMKRNLIGLMGICLISTSIFGVYSMKREKDIKELAIRAKQYEEEALTVTAKAPNPDNFTYVTSLDNIQVPVPTGYVASSVADEQYVNGEHETIYLTNEQDITLSADANEANPWTETSGVWKSGNYQVASSTSTLTTDEITVGASGGLVRLNISVSSQVGQDRMYIKLTNEDTAATSTIAEYSGTGFGTAEASLVYFDEEIELEQGRYTIKIEYTKNFRTNEGLDRAYLKSAKVYDKTETETENTYIKRTQSGGFVIYEGTDPVPTDETGLLNAQKTRNQYVWVPISISELANMYHTSSNKIYGNYFAWPTAEPADWTATTAVNKSSSREPALVTNYDRDYQCLTQYMNGITQDQWLHEMETRFYEMLESVATYGGFYVGRYETGNLNQAIPVVQKLNTNLASQTWYKMYQKCKRLRGANDSIDTNMIWGIQYDEVLKWILDTNEKKYYEVRQDSTSWGNYNNATFSYINTSGNTATKSQGSRTKVPTGSTERNKANNIYDLAGNVYDWTMESHGSDSRYLRGGYYDSDGYLRPAYYRLNDVPNGSLTYYGCRAVLYIK